VGLNGVLEKCTANSPNTPITTSASPKTSIQSHEESDEKNDDIHLGVESFCCYAISLSLIFYGIARVLIILFQID
jgi:hypothetical protein